MIPIATGADLYQTGQNVLVKLIFRDCYLDMFTAV
jgi:hypothetical protein